MILHADDSASESEDNHMTIEDPTSSSLMLLDFRPSTPSSNSGSNSDDEAEHTTHFDDNAESSITDFRSSWPTTAFQYVSRSS